MTSPSDLRRVHAAARAVLTARSIAVVGFMGVGKTSVGRRLAQLLGREFVDTDDEVVLRSGRTIPELFAEGESVFRALERRCVLAALSRPPCVISLGGGAFSQPDVGAALLDRACVVHLHTSWSAMLPLLSTLGGDRPLIGARPPWETQDLFLARASSYRRAHIRVSLQRHGVEEAAAAVAAVLTANAHSYPGRKDDACPSRSE